MANELIARVLKLHGITVRHDGNRLMAYDVATQYGQDASTWVDVTGWSMGQLRDWLGY